ncbi:MAG: hypothetical protein R2784_15275 [Saprospiraceae bacterium]
MDHAAIADGCIVHAETISKSVIGIRSRIGSRTKISNTIMMGADYYQTIEEMISNGNPLWV